MVKKYSAALHIFNSLLSVLSGDETLCLMLDILHKTLVRLLQELCMSSPNWVFSAYIFLCDLDYLQEILFSLETIIIRLSRWYHRTWLCFIFSTHFSVSGLSRQKRLQGRLLSIWTSDESLLVSWPHLTTCTTVCWEWKSSLAL